MRRDLPPTTRISRPSPTQLNARQRVLGTLSGAVPTVIGMPYLLGLWAPRWFTIAWIIGYSAVTVIATIINVLKPSPWLEQGWSIATSTFFATIPISAVLWSSDPQHFWISATIAVIFIAFEMATLPFLDIPDWRLGIFIVGATLTVCAFVVFHPVLGLAFALVFMMMTYAADRIRLLKVKLEKHLSEAQYTLGHDPLTNLLNRRGLSKRLVELDGEEITLAMIDVDRFKLINDSHGHQVGDKVLVSVAKVLSDRFGEHFVLARLGGDEFVAVAPGRVSLDSNLADPQRVTTRLHLSQIHI